MIKLFSVRRIFSPFFQNSVKIFCATIIILQSIQTSLAEPWEPPQQTANCKKPTYSVRKSVFIKKANFGSIAFSLIPKPLFLQTVNQNDCFLIKKVKNNQTIYFFYNHNSTDFKSRTGYIASQIFKKFKAPQHFTNNQLVHAMRSGKWSYKKDITSTDKIIELGDQSMTAFKSLAPSKFSALHNVSIEDFKETVLLNSFNSKYWHARAKLDSTELYHYPDNLRFYPEDSRSNPGFFKSSDPLPDDNSGKLENYLIRYMTTAAKDNPTKSKFGIPFQSTLKHDMELMAVSVNSSIQNNPKKFYLKWDR